MISLSFFNLRKRLPCTWAWIALCALPSLSFAQDQNHSDDAVNTVNYILIGGVADQDEITASEPNTADLSNTPFSTKIPLSEAEYEILKPLYQNTLSPFISSVGYYWANNDIKELESFQLPELLSEIDENRLTLEHTDALRRLQAKLQEHQAFLSEKPEDVERHALEAQYRSVFNSRIYLDRRTKFVLGFAATGLSLVTMTLFGVLHGRRYTTRCVDTVCAAGQQVIGRLIKIGCGSQSKKECIPSYLAGCLRPQNGGNITSFFDVSELGQCVLPKLPASLENVSLELVTKYFKYSKSKGFFAQCLEGCSIPQHLCFDETTNTILEGVTDASGCALGRRLLRAAWAVPTTLALVTIGSVTLPKYYKQAAIWWRSKRLPTAEMTTALADHHPHQVKQARLYEELLRILAELRDLPLKHKI